MRNLPAASALLDRDRSRPTVVGILSVRWRQQSQSQGAVINWHDHCMSMVASGHRGRPVPRWPGLDPPNIPDFVRTKRRPC